MNPGFYRPSGLLPFEPEDPPFLSASEEWVDSLMSEMSLEQKIGQMIMVPAYSIRDEEHLEDLIKTLDRYEVGGVVFFQGGPARQANMTNKMQAQSKIPLLIAIDAEWGLSMRLDSVQKYPRQMQLGAIQDNELIYKMGREIAEQLRILGVHMNFAPVADINNNPANPVIGTRSFGENRDQVTSKLLSYFLGMQSKNLLVTAKHFPGHGDTDIDSHSDLPVLDFSFDRLDSLELHPFKESILRGISGIMTAHLRIPALDDRENRPASLSEYIVDTLLQEKLGFKGLIVTDALNMKGASDHFKPGDLELEAVRAGNDILIMPSDIKKAIAGIKRGIRKGDISEARIEHSCRKILLAKSWLGLDSIQPVDTRNLDAQLNARKYEPLKHELAEHALTLLKNNEGVLPFHNLEKIQLATLNIGIDKASRFTAALDLYHDADHYYYASPVDFPVDSVAKSMLANYNTLIVSIYYTRSFGNNFDIPEGVKEFINSIDFEGDLIFNLFSYPYALGVLGDLDNMDAILISYTNDELNQHYAAQGMFGAIPIEGKLPVSIGAKYKAGDGIQTKYAQRLRYTCPESVHMNFDSLKYIDKIIEQAIQQKAIPGCQLLIARKGEVIWNKSYGYHTYRKRKPVENGHIYDLASITKIASSIPSLMSLQEMQQFSPDSTLASYLTELRNTDKGALIIKDILTHQSGLKAWIPFYYNTLEPLDTSQSLISANWSYTYSLKIGPSAYANRNIVFKDSIYQSEYSKEYPVKVANNLYMRGDYRDTIYQAILDSPLEEKEYRYSDLGYYYFYRIIEKLTDTLFYPYNWFNFYGPLGASTMGFLPLNRFEENRIVPTENDILYRKQLLQGNVHDMGASMLGGICGHAGLFSNANDLAKLMQMYLNNGVYGNQRFLDSATIAQYTSNQYPDTINRRGLGFDRPVLSEAEAGPVCNEASPTSYGHTGFTGTIAWVDPEYDLVYIFLSNRIHPDQYNTKLISMNVRTNIQHIIYSAIEDREVIRYPVEE
ncbi:glycoside hydrolase family 3 N-terminal domain-containing protein [Bacteroidota bacterium]